MNCISKEIPFKYPKTSFIHPIRKKISWDKFFFKQNQNNSNSIYFKQCPNPLAVPPGLVTYFVCQYEKEKKILNVYPIHTWRHLVFVWIHKKKKQIKRKSFKWFYLNRQIEENLRWLLRSMLARKFINFFFLKIGVEK